jgi:ABC-type polysaccharide/polyol phosphate transport system ATPase subunit
MAQSHSILECVDVWKIFKLHSGGRLLRDRVSQAFRGSKRQEFIALRNINFSVEEGESLGIIGRNGAGKSTLLSLICGLARPSQGKVTVNGRVAPLLSLGAGFHPDLSGRENLLLNAALMGFTEKEIRGKEESIIDFSGISDFIDEPLRTYSSGMTMRLAFSIAVNVEPEILIVDEILAVGDEAFTQKCLDRIHEMRRMGRTFICASHSATLMKSLCDRGIWLDSGELMMQGPIKEVMAAYQGNLVHAERAAQAHTGQ